LAYCCLNLKPGSPFMIHLPCARAASMGHHCEGLKHSLRCFRMCSDRGPASASYSPNQPRRTRLVWSCCPSTHLSNIGLLGKLGLTDDLLPTCSGTTCCCAGALNSGRNRSQEKGVRQCCPVCLVRLAQRRDGCPAPWGRLGLPSASPTGGLARCDPILGTHSQICGRPSLH